MPLLQAMAEQPPAIKMAAAHLPYMVVEAANRELQRLNTHLQKDQAYPYFCILHPNMVGTVSVS
jgi:plastocyanin